MFRLRTKLLAAATCGIVPVMALRWRQYHEEEQRAPRLQYLDENKVPLSGIQICERTSRFKGIGFVNKFLPTHHSVIVPSDSGKDQIGLSEHGWTKHSGRLYTLANYLDVKYPAEAYVTFYRYFSRYPNNPDPKLLAENLKKSTRIFGTPFRLQNGTLCLYTCQTALVEALYDSEKH
jgi:hypothetical protein